MIVAFNEIFTQKKNSVTQTRIV